MSEYISILNNMSLFDGIAEKDIESMLSCLSTRKKTYRKNETIIFTGEPAGEVGIICEGGAQVQGVDFMGNRTILSRLGVGDLFGETFACAKTERMPVNVIATADSVIMMINYRRILTTCSPTCVFHSRLIENMLGILASKNLDLNRKIEMLSKRSTREKLISYLSEQSQKAANRSFAIPFDRQELADYLCVDRSAMSSELSRLRDDGLIEYNRSNFQLLGDVDYEEE